LVSYRLLQADKSNKKVLLQEDTCKRAWLNQMAKSSTTSTCCHGGKSSPPIFPFWLTPPVPYSALRLWVQCWNVHSCPLAIRGPTSVTRWSPRCWTPSSTSAPIKT
jgi:hypothetical protein